MRNVNIGPPIALRTVFSHITKELWEIWQCSPTV